MPNKSYSEAVNWLFQQFPSYQSIGKTAYKPTLDNTWALVKALSIDLSTTKYIHVAGSNGKGSVCSLLASCSTEAGLKTGLFTSPHIHDFRERIRVNGEMIGEDSVISFVERVRSLHLGFQPSFFEISFVMALHHFTKSKCDICIIETGLGGRLDSTNVINPEMAVITSISKEHQQFLGNTLEEIALEKAGIIKKNKPVVLGEQLTSLLPVFSSKCRELDATMIVSKRERDLSFYNTPYLTDSYQWKNLRTVVTTLKYLDSKQYSDIVIQRGIDNLYNNTGFRGRLQQVSKNPLVILDAAHNMDGICKTLRAIRKLNYNKLHIIFGSSNDKDHEDTMSILPEEANYYFTSFPHDRSADVDQLKHWFSELNASNKNYFSDPINAYKSAVNNSKKEDLILIMGSIFLLDNFFLFFACE